MVASPRKRATRASFNQTWDDSDAASFDPSSLPVARIPRGWERKQETKRTEQGREKKIWRRFGLRSRASNAADEEDEEEHDVRARAVKKRQHMSPKAMEKTASRLNGKKRAFKATRYDRRKSVLPRKKQAPVDSSLLEEQEIGEESEEEPDATGEDLSYETIDVLPIPSRRTASTDTLPEQEDRRSTFTFSVHPEEMEELPGHDVLIGSADDDQEQVEADAPMEDATTTRLFRSPVEDNSTPLEEASQPLQYPELPQSDSDEIETDVPILSYVDGQYVEIPKLDETEPEAQDGQIIGDGDQELGTNKEALPVSFAEQEMATVEADVESVSDLDAAHDSAPADISILEELAPTNFAYPALPMETSQDDILEHLVSPQAKLVESDATLSSGEQETFAKQELVNQELSEDIDMEDELAEDNVPDATVDEDFTEESLQLDILLNHESNQPNHAVPSSVNIDDVVINADPEQDDEMKTSEELSVMETASKEDEQTVDDLAISLDLPAPQIGDITDGLTLSFTPAKAGSDVPAPRRLHSPPPPPTQSTYDDATMTLALDDDTALLKDFLTRAAASKAASKAAVITHRRESLQNRRDSDVVRHALASPRKVLEDKDPNSPSKYDNELTLDLSQNLTLTMDTTALVSPSTNEADNDDADDKASRGSRRSSRTKKSRLPAPASAAQAPAQTSKIAIRRADGTEHVVLKKSDAQELSLLTRANTRKNKQGAFGVAVRLAKLAADAANLPPLDDSTRELVLGKNIRWDQQLTYYQENPETVAERESLATPDELSMPDAPSTTTPKPKSKVSKDSTSTPKMRRVRGLGTANGTPGKGLLAPPSFPDSFDEEKEKVSTTQQLPRPRASKLKKMTVASLTAIPTSASADSKLPALEVMPVGIETSKERKSRLAAPKKVILPPSTAAVEGKENATTQRTGLATATPKKGIPAPKVVVPHSVGGGAGAGVESGLPRRRGRRV